MREMTVESVRINLQTQQRVVILKDIKQERYLFNWVPQSDTQSDTLAIALELQGIPNPRPLMHDLFKNTMDALGIKMVSIIISDLINDVFYARIVFEMEGRHIEIDARPCDAIAIAMRARIPIYVEDNVLERAGTSLTGDILSRQP